MEKYVLENNLTVYYYPVPSSYSVNVSLYINAGSRDDKEDLGGIAHLVEHMHFRKIGGMSQEQLYRSTDLIGTSLMASTYKDYTKYYLKVRPKYFHRSLLFFKELIEMHEWTSEDLDCEKKVVLNEIYEREGYLNNSQYLSVLLWRGDTLSRPVIGAVESVDKIDINDIIDFKKEFYNSNNTALFVAGKISETDILKANQYLSNIIMNETTASTKRLSVSIPKRKPDIVLTHYGWNILDVNVCFDVDTTLVSNEELTILNSILGGGTTSTLQRVIREALGLSSNIYSTVETYRDAVLINIEFCVNKKSLYDSLRKIVEILASLKDYVTDEDMETNLPFYTENLWYWMEDTELLNDQLGWDIHILNKPIYTIEEKIERFNSVTKERIIYAANTIFKKDNASIAILGSTSKITKKEIRNIFSGL